MVVPDDIFMTLVERVCCWPQAVRIYSTGRFAVYLASVLVAMGPYFAQYIRLKIFV
jgi:hypothetical protein